MWLRTQIHAPVGNNRKFEQNRPARTHAECSCATLRTRLATSTASPVWEVGVNIVSRLQAAHAAHTGTAAPQTPHSPHSHSMLTANKHARTGIAPSCLPAACWRVLRRWPSSGAHGALRGSDECCWCCCSRSCWSRRRTRPRRCHCRRSARDRICVCGCVCFLSGAKRSR